MEKFIQGQRLKENDLVLCLYDIFPFFYVQPFIPYWIKYSVGYIHPPTGRFLLIGPKYRIPLIKSPEKILPNFIVGRRWKPGEYELIWWYKKEDLSVIEIKRVRFEVVSDGITQSDLVMGNHFDLYAEYNLLLT